MKIEDIRFTAGCACCQEYDVADIELSDSLAKIMRVPQEDGTIRYMVIVKSSSMPERRYMKITEAEMLAVLTEL